MREPAEEALSWRTFLPTSTAAMAILVFVDFGCASRVPEMEIHHLRSEFTIVPAQAIGNNGPPEAH